jgi:hypothetical protein
MHTVPLVVCGKFPYMRKLTKILMYVNIWLVDSWGVGKSTYLIYQSNTDRAEQFHAFWGE